MSYYTFRYDYVDESFLDILGVFIKQNCMKYAIFKEIATETGKPHIQGKILPIKSIETFRRNLRDTYKGFFQKSNYSIAPISKSEEYDKYICKEKNVMINNVFTEEDIQNNYLEYWKVNKKIIASKTKKEKAKTWSEELTLYLRDRYPDELWTYNAHTIKLIGDNVLDKLGQSSKKLSMMIYKDLVLGQLNALNPSSGLKHKMYMDAFPDLYGSSYY